MDKKKKILAIVGMAGSGKSDVARFLAEKGLPVIRFGQQTDIGLKEKGLPLTEANERAYRVQLRQEVGMDAYAIKAKPSIDEALSQADIVILDGLYSWEEYTYLKREYPQLLLIGVFANRKLRYARLQQRSVRPLEPEAAEKRDIAEIEELHKAGPIALADYVLENNGTVEELKEKTEALLQELKKA